jgi:hypothetical protein
MRPGAGVNERAIAQGETLGGVSAVGCRAYLAMQVENAARSVSVLWDGVLPER